MTCGNNEGASVIIVTVEWRGETEGQTGTETLVLFKSHPNLIVVKQQFFMHLLSVHVIFNHFFNIEERKEVENFHESLVWFLVCYSWI